MMNTNVDKRSCERHVTMGLMSTVFDGKDSYIGVIEDISNTGVCLSQVPAVFDDTADHCYTVLKGGGGEFKVMLHPCWARATNRGMYKIIGFAVEDPPQAWRKFVERLATESHPLHVMTTDSEVEM